MLRCAHSNRSLRTAETQQTSQTLEKSEPTISPIDTSVPNVIGDTTSYAPSEMVAPATPSAPSQLLVPQPTDAPTAILSRTRRLGSIVLQSSYAFGRFVSLNPATELFNSLQGLTRTNDFKYVSFTSIALRFTPIANKYYRGLFALTFVPDLPKSDLRINPVHLSNFDSTLVDVSSTQTVEISIPWAYPLPKTSPSDLYAHGTLYVWVIDPVACDTAPGQTCNVEIQIEARFEGIELHDPSPNSSGPVAAVARNLAGPVPGSFYRAQARTVRKEAVEKAEKGTISSTLDSVSSIASAASVLPVVGGFASGLSVVASAASSVFDWFGLSMPPNLTIPHYVQSGQPPFMNTFSGVLNADVLAADQVPFVSTDPHLLASNADACNLRTITLRSSLVDQFAVPAVIVANGLLATIPVSPVTGWINNRDYFASNVGYATQLYRFWRGDLAYKFVISASPMTRTRLAITYSLDKLTAFSESARFMYLEVAGTTVVDGVVPWTSRSPYRALPKLESGSTVAGTANGYIQFWQMSNLLSDTPGQNPRPLSVAVFCKSGDNFQLVGPTAIRGYVTSVAQSFLGLDNSSSVSRVLPDDDYWSTREMLHRPSVRQNYAPTLPAMLDPSTAISADVQLQYILYRWRYMRGSITVHLMMATNSDSTVALSRIGRGTTTTANAETITYWKGSERLIMSVVMPFDTPTGFMPVVSTAWPSLVISNVLGPTPTFTWWVTFNDDLSLGVDNGSPLLFLPAPP